jgi:hypothetical protein
MLTAATRLVVEHDDPWRAFQIVAAVGPHIGPFGLAFAGIKLLHRRFIGMQHLALQEQFGQPIDQGCRLTPSCPTHCASVERAIGTPWRSLIFSMRYRGR